MAKQELRTHGEAHTHRNSLWDALQGTVKPVGEVTPTAKVSRRITIPDAGSFAAKIGIVAVCNM